MKHLKLFEAFNKIKPITTDNLFPQPKADMTVVNKTNQEILKAIEQMPDLNLPSDLKKPTKKDLITDIGNYLNKQGVKFELQVRTGQGKDFQEVLLPIMHLNIGDKSTVDITPDYFGVSTDVLGAKLGINYRFADMDEIIGGTRQRPGSRNIPNTKIGATLTIPILSRK
jgi:hypothetical protein